MRAAPGSLRWLLAQQLRWQWRARTEAQQRALGFILLAVGGGTVLAYLSLRGVVGTLAPGPLPTAAVIPLGGALLFVFTLMLSATIAAAVEMLYTRGDLDLLLHSPLAPRTVLASRAMGVALAGAQSVALLAVPAGLIALALGLWRGGLGLLVWLLDASLLSACGGLWLTLGLVRALGVRHTRTVASILGALAGASVFLVFQWRNLSGADSPALGELLSNLEPGRGPWPAADHPAWYGVRTLWFEAGPALALSLLSAGLFALTVGALTRHFMAGVQEVSEKGVARSPTRTGRPLRFRSGAQATLLKEWRLIWRDPELLSRTLLQLVYLIPLVLPLARAGGLRGAAGAGLVLLTSSLASALAHLTLNAEDAPDLLRSAPRPATALRREKMLAAALPCAVLGGLGLGALAAQGTLGTVNLLALLPLLALGTGGSALLVLWQPLPVRRSELFRAPSRPGLVSVLVQLTFQFALSATAFAASLPALWGLGTLALALLALIAASALRRPEAE